MPTLILPLLANLYATGDKWFGTKPGPKHQAPPSYIGRLKKSKNSPTKKSNEIRSKKGTKKLANPKRKKEPRQDLVTFTFVFIHRPRPCHPTWFSGQWTSQQSWQPPWRQADAAAGHAAGHDGAGGRHEQRDAEYAGRGHEPPAGQGDEPAGGQHAGAADEPRGAAAGRQHGPAGQHAGQPGQPAERRDDGQHDGQHDGQEPAAEYAAAEHEPEPGRRRISERRLFLDF